MVTCTAVVQELRAVPAHNGRRGDLLELYFGVPLSNFLGWLIVGAVGVGLYLAVVSESPESEPQPEGREPRLGVALYYAVIAFNLAVTGWIGEWRLLAVGLAVHGTVAAVSLRYLSMTVANPVDFGRRGVQSA
jgi:uncharacterized membrane protein